MAHSAQSGYAENRARATTVANTNRQVVHLSSKRGQAVRAAPTRMVGSSKKAPQINNMASNSDRRMASTPRIGPVSTLRVRHAYTPCHFRVFATTDRGNKNSQTFYQIEDGHNTTGCRSRNCSRIRGCGLGCSSWK